MSSLLERMEEVLERRKWSAQRWGREAGLSERSHVSGMMRLLRKSGRPFTGDLATWARLAEAADVSLDWLAFGKGNPWDGMHRDLANDEYPTRARILGFAHLTRAFSDDAVRQVAALSGFARDPGPRFWLRALLEIDLSNGAFVHAAAGQALERSAPVLGSRAEPPDGVPLDGAVHGAAVVLHEAEHVRRHGGSKPT